MRHILSLSCAALMAGVALSACAAQAQPVDPAIAARCTMGQAELKPLQPLTAVTAKGRYAFKVEMADTEGRRDTGLMCRTKLAPDRGMLFDFKRPSNGVAFWMRNTLIPLDIVFIRPDGRVLSIAHARALNETPLPAGGVVRGVLEIAAGRAAQIGLMPGDQVLHRIFPK